MAELNPNEIQAIVDKVVRRLGQGGVTVASGGRGNASASDVSMSGRGLFAGQAAAQGIDFPSSCAATSWSWLVRSLNWENWRSASRRRNSIAFEAMPPNLEGASSTANRIALCKY